MSTEIDLPGFSYSENFDGHGDIQKKSTKKNKSGGFQSMGLSYPVLRGIIRRGYNIPTPIQRKTIPLIIEGRDVVAMAKTGSGKTACFLIPLFEKLKYRQAKSGARALVLSPTRELAIQTFKFIKELGRFLDFKTVLILGGDSMDAQFSAIHTSPDIIVATPGRFLHLCVEMDLKLNSVEYVVMDEADRLFEMGFGEQLNETLSRLPSNKQMIMFSATLPKLMVDFAKAGLSDPVLIRLDVESKIPDALTLKFIHCRPEERYSVLLVLLKFVIPSKAQTVVFAGTQHHVELISLLLNKAGISNTFVYSTLDPSARKINTAKFAQNKVSVLIVTDVAARGIDIPNLDFVVNLHFPGKPKLFVHRVGRCARAGREGTAFTIFSTDDQAHLLDLHMFLSRPFNMADSQAVGVCPPDYLEEEHKAVLEWVEDNNIAGVYRTSNNAYKHYLQTRPTASIESNKRIKTMNFYRLRPLVEFAELMENEPSRKKIKTNVTKSADNDDEDKKENFEAMLKDDIILRMKSYRPSGTVFELNPHKSSVPNEVMRQKRVAHQNVIEKFKQKILDTERNEMLSAVEKSHDADDSGDSDEGIAGMKESTEDDIQNTFNKVVKSKKCTSLDDLYKTKIKKRARPVMKDTENYIPYVSADKHTEDGLAINNFERDARGAEFSVTADSRDGIQLSNKLQKWDRIKKKMVSVQDPRQGKIRTESGAWIPATYKTGRYTDWKQKSKVDDLERRNDDDDDEVDEKQRRGPLRRAPATHWARHNLKLELKKKQGSGEQELRRPEQIAKERIRKDKIKQRMSENRKKREINRKRTARQQRKKKKSD